MRIASDMTALTGKTPLVRLNRVVPPDGAEVAAKREFFTLSSSVKAFALSVTTICCVICISLCGSVKMKKQT